MTPNRFIAYLFLSFGILLLVDILIILITGIDPESFVLLIYYAPFFNAIPIAAFLILLISALGFSFLRPIRLHQRIHILCMILLQVAVSVISLFIWEYEFDVLFLAFLAATYLLSLVISSFIVNLYALRPLVLHQGKLWREVIFQVHRVYFQHTQKRIVIVGMTTTGRATREMNIAGLEVGDVRVMEVKPIRNPDMAGHSGLILTQVGEDAKQFLLNLPPGTLLTLHE